MAAGTPRRSMVLVDTPGLEDPNISKLSVVLQLRQWAEKHDLSDNVYLLYFFPINATRLPGSKSYCLEIFKALSSSSATDHSFIVTSMWNLVEGIPRLEDRAESNFKQLGNKSWLKSRIFGGPTMPTMLRFHATKKSAIDVLELCCKNKAGSIASISSSVGFTDTALGRLLYGSIITRLQDLRQRWTNTKQERLTSQDQYEVIQELDEEGKRIANNLKKFETAIKAGGFDRPPTPPPPHTPPPAFPILDVPPQSNNNTTESLTRGDIDLEPQHTQRTIGPQDMHSSSAYASRQF
ncbi:hypothetical protein BJ165DRAFT_298413 [Panaeolus papilionaceus]|nr:hypothetical protein BJ165DRAFT_298413 [Panaeolus papilionaceus]